MNLSYLKAPFKEGDLYWRIGRCGLKNNIVWANALVYITSRALYNRLDEVCDAENWQIRHKQHEVSIVRDKETRIITGTISELGIKMKYPDGNEWIWKSGGANSTDFEAFKGSLSDSDKRAGVLWGIGRYLYNVPETWVKTSRTKVEGWNYGSFKDKDSGNTVVFWWETPSLPKEFLPEGEIPRVTSSSLPETEGNDQGGATSQEDAPSPQPQAWKWMGQEINLDTISDFGKWLYHVTKEAGRNKDAPNEPELDFFKGMGIRQFHLEETFNKWLNDETSKPFTSKSGDVVTPRGIKSIHEIKNLGHLSVLSNKLRRLIEKGEE